VCEEIQTLLEGMDKKGYFSNNQSTFIFEDRGCPRMPVFYGLPKIHKLFQHFPPLRPIVSQIKSSTYNFSRYIDSFLKYQAQKCESYIRDTKDFLNKLKSIDKLPENSVLVTMNVAFLYTNIIHKEGAQACFEKLETRTKKRVPSGVLKQLIILVLSNNVFKFGDKIYRQIKGTAMGTPMAPNYANLFMDKFEREMLCDFEKQYGIRPFVWYRYIDDIFFVWTAGEESLTCFIQFVQNYSTAQNMESTMKFEVNISSLMVNFLDVKVYLRNGYLQTTLFTKPTDAHIYLNASSNHPSHVIKNLPKGQFIRVRRICSEKAEYFSHARQMLQYFLLRGYSESILKKTLQEVSCISRDELLMDKPSSAPKDPQVIYLSEYHPALKQLPTILKRHHHILKSDKKLYRLFPGPPTVAFRRCKSIYNHLVRSDISSKCQIRTESPNLATHPCGKCKLCSNIYNNVPLAKKFKFSAGTCKSSNVIYGAWCKKHNQIYVGQTSETLATRFAKHRYDIKKRLSNSELAGHFHSTHDREKDLGVFIIQQVKKNESHALKFFEDRWI